MKSGRRLLPLLGLLPVVTLAADPPMSQRLELLERRVNRITDLTLQLDEVRRENRELRGQVENLGYEIEQLKRKQRDIYLDIDQRLGAARPGAGLDPAPAVARQPQVSDNGAAPPPVPAPVIASTPPGAAPATAADRAQIQAEYQAAYELLSPQQKRYREAATAFAAFVVRHPHDELTPNAQYWLGEAHYVSQQNDQALEAFEKVVNRYPESTKAPGALFKIGRLQQAAGNPQAARASYQKVLTDYPNAPAAGLARQRLEQLGP
jgi:tol-pal system protein YbgF